MNDDLRSKRGRNPLDTGLKREHCVSVRLNPEELSWLDNHRGDARRGEYMRMATMNKLPPVVPGVNKEVWTELGKIGNNINQIARNLNAGEDVGIDEIREQLATLRASLLSIQK